MITTRALRQVLAAAADLALGSRCAGCDDVPGTLCRACAEVLYGPAIDSELPSLGDTDVVPVPLAVTTRYEGVGGAVVIAHKERGRLALAAPLGAALAVAVTAVLARAQTDHDAPASAAGEIAIVPAPSRRSATRRRGHDPMLRTARQAARVLRRTGVPAAVVPALVHRRAVADQHGLGREARVANVSGAMGVRARHIPRLRGVAIVVVDDVVTTGATMNECWDTLRRTGVHVDGVAAITAVGRW